MKLTDFEGMSWADAEIVLKENIILMALSKDEDTRQCALTIKNYGEEAATAILCATLFMKENGVQRTQTWRFYLQGDYFRLQMGCFRLRKGHKMVGISDSRY